MVLYAVPWYHSTRHGTSIGFIDSQVFINYDCLEAFGDGRWFKLFCFLVPRCCPFFISSREAERCNHWTSLLLIFVSTW